MGNMQLAVSYISLEQMEQLITNRVPLETANMSNLLEYRLSVLILEKFLDQIKTEKYV